MKLTHLAAILGPTAALGLRVDSVYPRSFGTSGQHKLRVLGEGLRGVEVALNDVPCEVDPVTSAANGAWVACLVPALPADSYVVTVRAAGGGTAAQSCDECVVEAHDHHNVFGLVDHDLHGCAGDTIHVTSAHHEHWWGLHEPHVQLEIAVGGVPVHLDEHSARFRHPIANHTSDKLHERSNVHQLHVRIPAGVEAGEHPIDIVMAGLHDSKTAHGKVELRHMHAFHADEPGVGAPARVLVRPAIHRVFTDLHTGLTTITGSGFALDARREQVTLRGTNCAVVETDFTFIIADCTGAGPLSAADEQETEDAGFSLLVEREDPHELAQPREVVRVRNEIEWPVANPAVHALNHFQTGEFTATTTESTVFVAPATGLYHFEMICEYMDGLSHEEDCALLFDSSEEAPLSLVKGQAVPMPLRFRHFRHGDNFRITTLAHLGGRVVVFHTTPARWFRHTRRVERANALSVRVNGLEALCRAEGRDTHLHCAPIEHNLKSNQVPPPLPPPLVRTESRRALSRRELQVPSGAQLFSAWGAANNCAGAAADCVIPAGAHVVLDTDADIGSMVVRGKFEWSAAYVPQALTMRTGFLVVEDDGELLLDASADRALVQTLYLKNNGKSHPGVGVRAFGTHGDQGTNPTAVVRGAVMQRTWTLLVANAEPGSTQLSVEHDVAGMGWSVGDRVAVAPTKNIQDTDFVGPETFTIAGMAGKTLTLSGPINQVLLGLPARKMQAEVINLSRNVVITGDDFTDQKGLHVISSLSGGRMEVKHTRVEKCGQRGELGRYCLHFHLKGVCPSCLFEGNAIENSEQRGLVVHGTHQSMLRDNVLFHVRGAGLYVEDGNELDNTFQDNVNICHATRANQKACATAGTDNEQADDVQQSGAWILSVTNNFVGNRLVNTYNAIFTQVTAFGRGKGAAQDNVLTLYAPLGRYEGNVCHTSWRFNLYLDHQYPRKLKRSLETNGLLSDIRECRNDPAAPCSADAFTADGADNGAVGYIVDSVDWGSLFVGQYDLADVQYLRHTSVHNVHNLYWKVTKPMARNGVAHLSGGTYGAYDDTPGYSDFAVANVAGPGGLGAFVVKDTTFFGRMAEGALSSNQHCTVGGTGGGCAPEFTLVNVDFSGIKAGSKWIQHGISGGDDQGPMYTAMDATSLPGSVVAVASAYQTHLLSIKDAAGAPVCQRAADLNLDKELNGGIACTKPLRRLQLWTPVDLGAVTVTAPGGGTFSPAFLAPPSYHPNKGGYSVALVVDAAQPLSYALNVDPSQVTIEFSDTVFGDMLQSAPDRVELVFNNGAPCAVTSQHDRRFISMYGPAVPGRGACKGNPDMPPLAADPGPPTGGGGGDNPGVGAPPAPAGPCTALGDDTWATGAHVACCDATALECLDDHAGNGNYQYFCVTTCSGTVVTNAPDSPLVPGAGLGVGAILGLAGAGVALVALVAFAAVRGRRSSAGGAAPKDRQVAHFDPNHI